MTTQVQEQISSSKYFPAVRTTKIEFESFDASKIRDSLIQEVGLSLEAAEGVAGKVVRKINESGLSFLSSPLIREFVCTTLLEENFERERARYTRLGLPVYDVTMMLKNGDDEDANLQHNPETIHKLAADAVLGQYALLYVLPSHLTDAHMSGEIHIHEIEYFVTRPFCQEHDLRFFLKRGLMVDGSYSTESGMAAISSHIRRRKPF